MPQQILPLIPYGSTPINDIVSIFRDEDRWTYFLGLHPIYTHMAKDNRMFRLVTSQLIESGTCRQVDIINTFGVSKSSVIRSVKQLRTNGAEAFFKQRSGRRGGKILSPSVLDKAQDFLNQGYSRRDTAKELSVRYDTLRKAINDGRLEESKLSEISVSKSSRSVIDTVAAEEMGTACTRVAERILTSLGKCIGAPIRFETCLDVPKGGVLCALPLLIVNGLLSGVDHLLGKVKGYYTAVPLLMMLAFMALCRIKTVEKLRGHAPGEFGKLLGLDRIPEVRCLRNKLDELSTGQSAERWAAHLSKQWMSSDLEDANILRVRVHTASRPAANRALNSLFEKLYEAEVPYPETNMILVYELGGAKYHKI